MTIKPLVESFTPSVSQSKPHYAVYVKKKIRVACHLHTNFVDKLNRYTGKEAEALAAEPTRDWAWVARFLRREFSWHWQPGTDGPLPEALST